MSDKKTQIELFFTSISPYSYLGHKVFADMVKRLDLEVTYRPVKLMQVFEHSGGTPMPKRHPARIQNRFLELQRWRDRRNLPMNIKPKFFPVDPALADCVTIALQEQGIDPADFHAAALGAVWAEERDLSNEDTIAQILTEQGHDAVSTIAAARSDAIQGQYEANTQRGLELNIIGSPCVVYQDEPFWGQDRFDFVEDAIKSGRTAYSGD